MKSNQEIAKEIGIKMAINNFNMLLNTELQSFLFSWDDKPSVLIAKNSVRFYILSSDMDIEEVKIEELEEIAMESFKEEYSKQKEKFNGKLPLRIFTEKEKEKNIFILTTGDKFISSLKSDYYKENRDKEIENFEKTWEKLFEKEFNEEKIKEKALSKAKTLFIKKEVLLKSQNDILDSINAYWNNNFD